jgi:DNA-binding MarR family transcriptional regulator
MLNSATHLLIALHRAHRATLEPVLTELGLNHGSELAHAAVAGRDGIGLSELATRLEVKPPTVTKVIRSLERAGLVARTADASDGRVVRLHLTAEASAASLRWSAWAAAEVALLAA